MIKVKVNNVSYEFATAITLGEALEQLAIPQNGIAVAINQNIISKPAWETTQLAENDDVLIIKATQGG